MSTPVSPAVRHTTTAAVVVVAGIAAAVSYSHMQQLADHAGEAWRSWLIPVSIDGLVVAASMVLLTRRRAGLPGGRLAWGALSAGVLASLAANMADARHEVTAVLIAGWPAAAFAVGFELLLQQRRAERAAPMISGPDLPEPCSGGLRQAGPGLTWNAPIDHSGSRSGQADTVLPVRSGSDLAESPPRTGPIDLPVRPTPPGPDRLPADPAVVTGPLPAPVRPEVPVRPPGAGRPTGPARKRPARTSSGSKRAGAAGRTEEQLVQAARDLAGRSDGPLTQYALRQAFGLGSARAARLLAQLDPVPAGAPGSNGAALRKEN